MHENNGFVSGQHHVGFAGQFFVVQPVAEAVSVQEFTDDEFGFGVFAAHPAHVGAALRGGMYVGHAVAVFVEVAFIQRQATRVYPETDHQITSTTSR